ncbi:hypothetical protein P5673_017383 [Acropora cervicornis]|uniref:Uncharacterized protein n=1 Tax=Acropora cervicornis TaxID=6130 RepID=A0AAD9V3J3_ACRCE|nr:hypothetical protein P5673_017383 [Acropora cervicornis]
MDHTPCKAVTARPGMIGAKHFFLNVHVQRLNDCDQTLRLNMTTQFLLAAILIRNRQNPCELSFSAGRLNSQLSPSFTQQNSAEFSSESRIHASIYEWVNCVGEVEEKHTEELYVSRHLANETKSP